MNSFKLRKRYKSLMRRILFIILFECPIICPKSGTSELDKVITVASYFSSAEHGGLC